MPEFQALLRNRPDRLVVAGPGGFLTRCTNFAQGRWQRGYSAFSVSVSRLLETKRVHSKSGGTFL